MTLLDHSPLKPLMPAVRPAEPAEAPRLFEALARAFAADPAVRWLFPGAQSYRRWFPRFAQAFAGAAIPRRTAWMCSDGQGAALWLPPDAQPDEEALAALIEEGVESHRKAEAFAVFEEMAGRHPTEPNWYLPLIGVAPARQGCGLGSALLQPVLADCDAAGIPAYLESTNPRNRPLYERHGFEAAGEIRVGTCPPITPMLRRPRSVAT